MIRIKFFTSILLFIIVFAADAQKVDLGIEFATNVIPVGNNDLNQNYRLGLHSGLRGQFQVKNNFYLTSGLSISQKAQYKETVEISSLTDELSTLIKLAGGDMGFDIDSISNSFGISTDVITTNKIAITSTNIQLPVLATYCHKNVQLHLGGYVSLLLTAKQKIQKTKDIPVLQVIDIAQFDTTGFASFFLPDPKSITYEESLNNDNLKKYDFGAIVGISYFYNKLNFGFYYNHGLIDYENNTTKTEFENNRNYRFSISYLLNFKKEDNKIIIQ